MKLIVSIAIVWVLSWSLLVSAQGHTNCLSGSASFDWYTDSVGETPCQTYQRLRQICNSVYTVGSMSTTSAPDICNDQVSGCCCNSISFALAMLCLNCQQGKGEGTDSGFDAPPGLYEAYLGKCSPVSNKTLPADIQTAVCNNKIKIFDDLYSLFWATGAWFYIFTKETIQKNQQAFANNTFTHCASTTIDNSTNSASRSSSITTSSSTTTATSPLDQSSDTRSISRGAIGGIVAGVTIALLVIGMLVWFFRRRHDKSDYAYNGVYPVIDEDSYNVEPYSPPTMAVTASYSDVGPTENPYPPVPFLAGAPKQPSGRSEKGGQPVILRPDHSNNASSNHPTSSTSQPSTSTPPSSLSPTTSDVFGERHADGGPVLARSASGRLPPAYGEQL